MANIFDSHAHYDGDAFDEDRAELLESLPEKGVFAVLNCGSNVVSSLNSLELTRKYDYIYAACGVHPHEAGSVKKSYLETLANMFKEEKCVAVGEIGLDYHYDFSPRDVQKKVFEEQLILAKELDLPVVIHDREAHEDTMNLIEKYRPRGVLHCFSGSAEMARQAVNLGMYIGLGGAVTFKNARRPLEVAAVVPRDKLLIETDCPYMTPVPFRGQRNDSTLIPYTARVLAGVRNCSEEEILELTKQNALELFRI